MKKNEKTNVATTPKAPFTHGPFKSWALSRKNAGRICDAIISQLHPKCGVIFLQLLHYKSQQNCANKIKTRVTPKRTFFWVNHVLRFCWHKFAAICYMTIAAKAHRV